MARATMTDERAKISLRVPKRDLTRLKSRALQEGIPYQTLINALIHRYVSDCGRDRILPATRRNPALPYRVSIHSRAASGCQLFAALRGRPPLAPLEREAAAFLGDLVRPARRASSRAIQARLPKMPLTSAGT